MPGGATPRLLQHIYFDDEPIPADDLWCPPWCSTGQGNHKRRVDGVNVHRGELLHARTSHYPGYLIPDGNSTSTAHLLLGLRQFEHDRDPVVTMAHVYGNDDHERVATVPMRLTAIEARNLGVALLHLAEEAEAGRD